MLPRVPQSPLTADEVMLCMVHSWGSSLPHASFNTLWEICETCHRYTLTATYHNCHAAPPRGNEDFDVVMDNRGVSPEMFRRLFGVCQRCNEVRYRFEGETDVEDAEGNHICMSILHEAT